MGMSRRAGRNGNDVDRADLDCVTCIHRADCERAAEGSFCTQWQSHEVVKTGVDPNEAWKRGDDVDFDG